MIKPIFHYQNDGMLILSKNEMTFLYLFFLTPPPPPRQEKEWRIKKISVFGDVTHSNINHIQVCLTAEF